MISILNLAALLLVFGGFAGTTLAMDDESGLVMFFVTLVGCAACVILALTGNFVLSEP